MIEMFDAAGDIPENVWFSKEWWKYYYAHLHDRGQSFEDWQ